jgi:hypothetical protein
LAGGTGTGAGFPFSGSAQITGSLGVTGSLSITGSITNWFSTGTQSGSLISNITDNYTDISRVDYVVTLTSASYASLGTKNANTLYLISGSTAIGTNGTSGTSGVSGTSGINGTNGVTSTVNINAITIADEGTAQGTATFIDFIGSGVTATVTSNTASITISGGGGSGFPFTGSAVITGSLIVTGSARGNVVSMSIASATASLDMDAGNYFTCLASGSFFVNVTNLRPGDTANLILQTVGIATASFSTNVKQPSGSLYRPTSGSGQFDVLSFVSVDSTSTYLVSAKKFV